MPCSSPRALSAVEIRLEYLRLGPGALDAPGGLHLRPLACKAAAATCVQGLLLDQPCELHGDRACAAATVAAQHLPCRGGECAPVDAAMLVEPLVLDADDRRPQRRRDFLQCHPLAAKAVEVEPVGFEDDAVAIEHPAIRGAPFGAHAVERRRDLRGLDRRREQHQGDCECSCHLGPRTCSVWFGSSPNISGAYIASTRVAGMTKLPALLSRSVYSTRNDPFGT